MVPKILTVVFTSVFVNFVTCQSNNINENSIYDDGNNFLLCYTCASVNASLIVAGAGVDPGVFLTTIPLQTIPVTRRCVDPYDGGTAVRVGVDTDFCDKGLCVKMNFTNKLTSDYEVLRACLPRTKGVFKETCISFSSSQAFGTWCVCDGELCNSGSANFVTFAILLLSFFILLIC